MLFFKKIKPDRYLKKFIDYCKEQYGGNLLAIVIYGSYPWGYFNKKKSDYDVFVIFKDVFSFSRNFFNYRAYHLIISCPQFKGAFLNSSSVSTASQHCSRFSVLL